MSVSGQSKSSAEQFVILGDHGPWQSLTLVFARPREGVLLKGGPTVWIPFR